MSAAPQSLGSGIPTAVCCPCICCLNWATSSSVQQSCRKTAARLRRRGLSDREKRSMHCTMAALVISERDEGEMRFIKVVMADRTVSSLWLDRQFVTKLIPLFCKMMSWHSGSILRLHSPPGRNTRHNTTDYQWRSDERHYSHSLWKRMHTQAKLHKILILLSEHVQEEVSHLKFLQVLHVLWVICKVGQVGQHLLLRLWQRKESNINNVLFKFNIKIC